MCLAHQVVTRFGLADVVRYPLAPHANRDEARAGGFVEVLIRTQRPDPRHTRVQLAALLGDRAQNPLLLHAVLSLEDGVSMLATASARARRLQCRFRIHQAKRLVQRRRRRRDAARKIQRAWRRYKSQGDWAARKIQMRVRGWLARKRLEWKRREVRSALALQCAFRVFKARQEVERRRCVADVRVMACSTRLSDKFAAAFTVDPSPDTMWISKEGRRYNQWISFDLGRPVNLAKLVLRCVSDTSCPRFTTLRYAHEPAGPFRSELMTLDVAMTKRPQHFHAPALPKATARYWRMDFVDNHGSSAGTSLVQVRR